MGTRKTIKRFMALALGLVITLVVVPCAMSERSSSPKIYINPTSGGANTRVAIAGEGFESGTVLDFRLGPPDVGATPESYGQVVVESEGAFFATFAMPGQWPDGSAITETDLIIVAINDNGCVKATAPFDFKADVPSQLDLSSDLGVAVVP